MVDYEADVENAMHAAARSALLMHREVHRLGLAWTPVSGELVPVEVTAAKGKGRLIVPRKWSALLEEPAQAAFDYVRANTARLLPEVDASWFTKNDVQVVQAYGNVPVGATVADGHAAGAAVVAALVSYLGHHLVAPAGNQAEAMKIAQRRRQGVELVFAGHVDEALHKALTKRAVKGHS